MNFSQIQEYKNLLLGTGTNFCSKIPLQTWKTIKN